MAKTIYADQLAHALDHCDAPIEVLSLDCFDTLLWRTTPAPSDVFCDLPRPMTRHARMVAEQTARERRLVSEGFGEVDLGQIYACALPDASAQQRQELATAELAAEHRHCVAFPACVELIHRAKECGLKVVVVSDTYLSETELRGLIEHCAGKATADLIDIVFCSSAHDIGKTDGLFQKVIKRLGIAASRILHVGDNPKADVVHAEKHGLQSLHLEQGDSELQEQWRLEATAQLMSDDRLRHDRTPMLAHRLQLARGARSLTNPAERIGYASLGPLMYGFARWVQQEARSLAAQHQRVKVCFLMRDGHLPKLAYEAVRTADDPQAYAVEISRFTAFAATMRSLEDIQSYLGMMFDVVNTEPLAQQLLFSPSEISDIQRKIKTARNPVHQLWTEIKRQQNLRLILERSSRARERLFDYLHQQVGLESGDVLLLVDIGAAGTVQNRVQSIIEERFGVKVEGRYLLLRDVPRADQAKRGFLGPDRFDGRLLEGAYTYIALIEQLCTISQGSVVGYTPDGEPIRKSAHFSEQQIASRSAAQRACLNFISDAACAARSEAGQTDTAIDLSARAAMLRLLFLPTREESVFFETFSHDMNLGVKDTLPLADSDAAREDLRRIGPLYVNSTLRIHAPSELRRHGLDLALMLLTRRRFDLDLRAPDLRAEPLNLSVLIAKNQQASVTQVEAIPTFEGYYAALIPLGKNEFSIGLMFGQAYSVVQIESVRAMPSNRQFSSSSRAEEIDLLPNAAAEGCEQLIGGLVSFPSDQGFLYFDPPRVPTDESWSLRVVFRPIAHRAAQESPAAQSDAIADAAAH